MARDILFLFLVPVLSLKALQPTSNVALGGR